MTRVAIVLAVAALASTPRRAEACGGCFAPTDTVTTVDSHRMVVALSTTETILWDQIRYTGDPRHFVWVLPIPTPDARVELADAAFFDELDSQTTPRIQPAFPLTPCNFAAGCGDSGNASASAMAGTDGPYMPEEEVTVYSEETVGPYETLIIGSEDASALRRWLLDNGYRITPETEPVLDHYIDLGSEFIVLRLAPGQGVQAMQPIRVHYPGYMAQFPLKMVTVGAQGVVALSLWVVAEQRYETRNHATVEIDEERLTWDWAENRSNYAERFDATIDEAGGRAWVVEHASPLQSLVLSTLDSAVLYGLQKYPYLTRLRTRMLVDHLDDDLDLMPAYDYGNLTGPLIAYQERNRPEGDCNQIERYEYGCSAAAVGARLGQALGPMLLVLAFLTWRWRVSARARRPTR